MAYGCNSQKFKLNSIRIIGFKLFQYFNFIRLMHFINANDAKKFYSISIRNSIYIHRFTCDFTCEKQNVLCAV